MAALLTAGFVAGSVSAQTHPTADRAAPAPSPAPATREAEIEAERQAKAAELQPDEASRPEQVLNYIKEHKIVERITAGIAGFRVRLGGLVTGSGFAAGPEYYRHDLLHEQLMVRASARASLSKFYLMDAEAGMPSLAHKFAFVNLYARHENYPHIDYYGPGPNSAKTGRSSFLLEDTSFQTTAGIRPIPHLRLAGLGRYLLVNVSRGRDDRFASTDRLYTEATAPGIRFQSNFLEGGGFIEYDWRDNPGGPRSGGYYRAQYSSYSDLRREHYSFDRVDLEAQQYVSFFNQRRVIALRGRIQAAEPHTGNVIPFYLQPTLGGSDDLRGYRPFRFYANTAAVLNGEYRWEVFSGMDMALFVDAGQVFNDWRQINFRQPKTDYGFGLRFNVRNDVFMRIDTAFSHEGFQVWLKFNNVF